MYQIRAQRWDMHFLRGLGDHHRRWEDLGWLQSPPVLSSLRQDLRDDRLKCGVSEDLELKSTRGVQRLDSRGKVSGHIQLFDPLSYSKCLCHQVFGAGVVWVKVFITVYRRQLQAWNWTIVYQGMSVLNETVLLIIYQHSLQIIAPAMAEWGELKELDVQVGVPPTDAAIQRI